MTNPTASPSQAASDTSDWLGYGAYADALWSRTMRALDKDKDGKKPLGDDPLVIGIFGEWGAGKSHLLKLVYRLAQDQSARDIADRIVRAPTHVEGELPLTVTVPVMFQPWKYEHEPHLHVPLAIHVADALDDAWKRLPADFEQVKVWVERGSEGVTDVAEKLEKARGWLNKLDKLWSGAKEFVKSDAAEIVSATVDVLATAIGAPPLVTVGLNKAREYLEEAVALDAGAPGAAKPNANKAASPGKATEPAKPSRAEQRSRAFSNSSDGLAFYRIHKLMHAMTRPKLSAKLLKGAGLKIADGIEFDLRINFVVFVDDLDRCLPEKAVETLELIKTMFNIESFAFVLALDDEVIERGIGHRYKDYQLQGKKPEMPITGFEYLEKIVHLPFRLPALNARQARAFMIQYEEEIEPQEALRWFSVNKTLPLEESSEGALSSRSPDRSAARGPFRQDFLDIALSGFDVYVPRKMIRLVELMHQIGKIAALRETPLQRQHGGQIDCRVVLALLLIQLFQPDLFRIMRRRQESFPALLRAFSKPAETSTAIEPELIDAKVSDLDLWRWAVKPNVTLPAPAGISAPAEPGAIPSADPAHWKPSPQEPLYSYAVQLIMETHPNDSAARTTAQHVRLPMVAQIVEHRAAQRHVFDVLKLLQALAIDMEATFSKPHQLDFEPYRSFLAKSVSESVSQGASQRAGQVLSQAVSHVASSGAGQGVSQAAAQPSIQIAKDADSEASLKGQDALSVNHVAGDTRRSFALRNVKELLGDLLSEDTSAQANMASRHELRDGHVLDEASVTTLTDGLRSAAGDKTAKLRVLNGLQFLAPFVTVEAGKKLWDCVIDCVDLNDEPNPKLRALWGDVRAKLGCDPRFETTGLCFARKDIDDPATGFSTQGDKVPGFALIDALNKPFWFGDGGVASGEAVQVQVLETPFFLARTLTTVSQYAQFVKANDYASHFEGEGREWLDGSYDSKVSDENLKNWLARRPKEQRAAPHDWQDQLANPLRPVINVCWFEAQAYVQWLNASFGLHDLAGYTASLPTELQWECAARYAADGAPSQRVFPWKHGPASADAAKKEFELYANLGQLVGHPTTVGLYPKGCSDGGLADMAGNVWEWMGHAYVAGYDPNEELESQKATDARALRGGSWFDHPGLARCSCRGWDRPGGWYYGFGFRVVLSLTN